MESQKPKVAMYVKRSFGEKLNASFDFIKENWKLLLKFITYLLLPVSLIQALSLNGLMGGALKISAVANITAMAASPSSLVGFMSYYGLYMLVFMIGTILLTSLIYAMIRTYNEREERLEGITLGSLKPLLFHNKEIAYTDTFRYPAGTHRGGCDRCSRCFIPVHFVSDHSCYYCIHRAACLMGAHLLV